MVYPESSHTSTANMCDMDRFDHVLKRACEVIRRPTIDKEDSDRHLDKNWTRRTGLSQPRQVRPPAEKPTEFERITLDETIKSKQSFTRKIIAEKPKSLVDTLMMASTLTTKRQHSCHQHGQGLFIDDSFEEQP
ncbi:hypothetical protein HDE_03950 [Halotydeus destructor]|nr:hypothetical protein HDE_03950 [Halotydeus destructor]